MSLTGLYTAVITPFTSSGELDQAAFTHQLEAQILGGVDGVVVCGSTGEGATISTDEKVRLWHWAVEHSQGRIKVIAGSGTNDTRHSIELSKKAEQCGVDGLLVVTPFYNKPTPAGQIGHFKAIAESVPTPIMMYNVPSRTSTNMAVDTQLTLAESCKNIVATKEASANLEQIAYIIDGAPEHFNVLSGDDVLAIPVMALGGRGSVAVVSNYAPRLFSRLVHAAMNSDFITANEIQHKLNPLYRANFIETNPGPVKYMMELLGHGKAVYRLPMVPPAPDTQAKLVRLLEGFFDA